MYLYPFKKKLILYAIKIKFYSFKQILFSISFLNKFFWFYLKKNTFFLNKNLIKFLFYLFLIDMGLINIKKLKIYGKK